MTLLHDTIAAITPADAVAVAAADDRQADLTKPPGSLGQLEALGRRLAGIAGMCPPPVPSDPVVAVFAGDHGVLAAGVTPWPQEVTAQMVANFEAGGAAVNVIARQVGARVEVIDVGVVSDLTAHRGVRHHKVRAGTADLSIGAAMSIDEARQAVEVGIAVATDLVAEGADLLLTGEMGIGNTTPTACLVAALTGSSAAVVTGRGTGVDDEHLARKVAVVEAAVARIAGTDDPLEVLAEVGGLEIAALAGLVLGGAAAGVPVVVDGVICGAALLVAARLCPDVVGLVVAGHRSTEPAASIALEELGLVPLLDLDMRLGEGSGACLAVPLVQVAARVLHEMATFSGAAVTDRS